MSIFDNKPPVPQYPRQQKGVAGEEKQLPWPEELGPTRPQRDANVAPQKAPRDAADVLARAAQTFRERNAVYANNYRMVAPIVKILFPNGVPSSLVVTDQWHLFELMIVKMTRFAVSELAHADSIRDAAVYAAMIEAILEGQQQ